MLQTPGIEASPSSTNPASIFVEIEVAVRRLHREALASGRPLARSTNWLGVEPWQGRTHFNPPGLFHSMATWISESGLKPLTE